MTGLIYHCGTSLRRQRVSDSNVGMGGGLELNGIDFVEIVDGAAPTPELRQRLIDVVFLKADGVQDGGGAALLGPENFALTGGTRITRIKVTGVTPGAAPNHLRLTLDQPGDFSPYTLSLRQGPVNSDPPPNMDLQLASVTLNFKVECPSDFDCKPEDPAPPARAAGPHIDYLTRDWQGFRRLMLDRMSTTMPGWTERNPADLGVTLVEALADAADKASWFQDAMGTEAFFERARFRQSVTRHARLLGYRPGEGCNARVAVAVTADLDRLDPDPVIPVGARLLTPPEDVAAPLPTALPQEPELMEELIGRGALVFEVLEPLTSLRIARNAMALHNWGDEDCCLPIGAVTAHLVGAPADLGLAKGDLLVLEERFPFGGTPDDPPDPTHRQLVRLAADPVALRDPVFGLDLTEITWHGEDALRFALTLEQVAGRPGAVARGNILLADEGRTVDYGLDPGAAGEDGIAVGDATRTGLLPDDGPGQALRYRLAARDLVYAVPHAPAEAASQSAHRVLAQVGDPVAAVSLEGDGETWEAQPDLLASDRFAPHVVVEPGTGGGAYVRFGDGVLGRAPSNGEGFTARLRHGGGRRGNIGAGALAHVVTGDGSGIGAIENPLPAMGGRGAEPTAAVHIAAPQAFRTPKRAVTAQDYADAAQLHPGVERAFGQRRWTGSWYTITLAIDRVGGAAVDASFEDDLRAFIAARRLAGHDLEILSPVFVSLDIALYVCAEPDVYAADVNRALLRVFSDQLAPDGQPGAFHPDILGFGQDVLLSPLIARAMEIEGVGWVGITDGQNTQVGHFRRMDQPDVDYHDTGVLPIARGEIARLENDPSTPERGRIRFIIEGGQ